MISFSIIIPVYNVSPYLGACLNSVMAQSFSNWECICVDDGSTDGSAEILESFAQTDPRIRVLHIKNGGVSNARNEGLEMAIGEYVTFVDADDVLQSEWLLNANKLLAERKLDLLRFRCTDWNDGTPLPNLNSRCSDYKLIEGFVNVVSWGWHTFVFQGWVWLLFIRRSCLADSFDAKFKTKLRCYEDNVFALTILPSIKYACQSEFPGYYYRNRFGSASKKREEHDEFDFLCELFSLARRLRLTSSDFSSIIIYPIIWWRSSVINRDKKKEQLVLNELLYFRANRLFRLSKVPFKWRMAFVLMVLSGSLKPVDFFCRLKRGVKSVVG